MATPRDERFRQAAWVYAGYGVIYWLGGLFLAAGGLGPRGTERGGAAWFVVGALLIVVIPWLLRRERAWFERWVLSRRDFARVLTVLVALRALEVGRIAWARARDVVMVRGLAIHLGPGALAFALVTVLTAVALARAAWSRDP
jgi:hypothetical protein